MLQDQSLFKRGGSRRCAVSDGGRLVVVPAAPVRRRSTLQALARPLRRILAAIKGRRVLARLNELDDRLLADIGITRRDLSDASCEPLLRDPTGLLARRAGDFTHHPSASTGEPSHVAIKPIYFVGC